MPRRLPRSCGRPSALAQSTGLWPPPFPSPAVVYGSFPYERNSSVCLAALHCGLMSNSSGGLISMSRMHAHEPTSPTASIFPFESARGSYSNGVQSREVPHSWHSQPAGLYDWAAAPRLTVGVLIAERQIAPFSPRAQHSHTPSAYFAQTDFLGVAELIVGGHNATHSFNVPSTTHSRISAHPSSLSSSASSAVPV